MQGLGLWGESAEAVLYLDSSMVTQKYICDEFLLSTCLPPPQQKLAHVKPDEIQIRSIAYLIVLYQSQFPGFHHCTRVIDTIFEEKWVTGT